jgi:hypothetical protein
MSKKRIQDDPKWKECKKILEKESVNECICDGNWRIIVKECEQLIGEKFIDNNGVIYTFFGLVHGKDDYYYGMWNKEKTRLLSCVGNLYTNGFTPI